MKELIFIRHAETDLSGRYCGHSNPAVNAVGQTQIQKLLRELEHECINAVVTSDLRRAVTTAKAVTRAFAVELVIRPQLREINFGEWEGLSWREVVQADAAFAQRWMDAFPWLPPPGGEMFETFRMRVLDEVAAIVNSVAGSSIAVITHGGVLRVILQTLLGASEEAAVEMTRGYCCWFKYKVQVSL